MQRAQFVEKVERDCPAVKAAIDSLAKKWLASVIERLDRCGLRANFPKTFNDPVWGTVELLPWEVTLLDSPLVQRLRGVRQLGLAHFVYPGAGHDRLEHARGVVEAAERMLSRLARNAEHRRSYGARPDSSVPLLSKEDHYVVRLAALLHDLGHGPFSHAIEPLIEQRHFQEFRCLSNAAREAFDGAGSVSVSEGIALLLVLSPAMDSVLNHGEFAFPVSKTDLAMRLISRIIGARSHLAASYLSGVVSGPVDADKLDYMARDGHHAGLSVGLDTDRLLSKLEVITITQDNTPPRLGELRERAVRNGGRTYDMGISISGIGAYEQMIVGRVVLYDRLYYHHKVRAADAMAQRLVQLAEEERGEQFTIQDLFLDVSDDTMIEVLGGRLKTEEVRGGGNRARELAAAIRERRLYHRAFAFASRFVAGLDGFQNEQTRDTERAALWRQVTRGLDTFKAIQVFEQEIFKTAQDAAEVDANLVELAKSLRPEHIIVDLPANKARAGGNLLLTRTENDEVGIPNLFFDPERWSNAYDQQKRCGYVFCPREQIPLVSLASRIAVFRRFRFGVTRNADRFTKTSGVVQTRWIDGLATLGVIDLECQQQLREERVFLSRVEEADLIWPAGWVEEKPEISKRIAEEIGISRPGGFISGLKKTLLATMNGVADFVRTVVEGGEYSRLEKLPEAQLQQDLRKHLRARGQAVREGAEVGGGETDLLADDQVLIENKVAGASNSPMSETSPYPFQARRYAIALCKTAFVTVVAYQPTNESHVLRQSDSVAVLKVGGIPEDCVEVRFAVPFGTGRPSQVKRPPADGAIVAT
jgi:HD superfamily phosphohydrolase